MGGDAGGDRGTNGRVDGMKALVTGGGGFLGSTIARMLHARGHEVVALGRGRYPRLEAEGIRTIQADIADGPAVRRACRGADVVFHVAALPAIWGPKADFWRTNVVGTRNVIAACRAEGVTRLVHTSTPSVVFGKRPLCGVDESQPYPRRFLAEYPRTKAVAEQEVLAANSGDLATVALRPHLIWGPGDPHLIPRIVERAERGQLRVVGREENLVDITYIDNAASAHVAACDRLSPGAPCSGRAFFISQGEPVRLWSWLRSLLAQIGAPPPRRPVPLASAYAVGAIMEAIFRLTGRAGEPPMTRFLALQLAHSHYFDVSAARELLGYEPAVSTEEGLSRLVRWLKHPVDPDGRGKPCG